MVLEAIGKNLIIHHMSASYQCCLVYYVEYDVANFYITAFEYDVGAPCDCICPFNLKSILYDLEAGLYTVRLIGIEGNTIGLDSIMVGRF
jgi:hypothetical protein